MEKEVQGLLQGALRAAKDVVEENRELHEDLSRLLGKEERVEGTPLESRLAGVRVPPSLEAFLLGSVEQGDLTRLVEAYKAGKVSGEATATRCD